MGHSSLSEEQQAFMDECLEEFKTRYTDDDEKFKKYMDSERQKPPIVDPWYNKPRRPQYDWRQGKKHWDRDRNRDDRDNRRRNDSHYDRNDRHSGRHHMNQRNNSRPY